MSRPDTAAVRLLTGEREPVRLATTANLATVTVSGISRIMGLKTIDGILTAVGDRVLVKDQTDARINGIYTASEGYWYRAADARTSRTMQKGTTVHVQLGTVNTGLVFEFATDDPVIGTDNIVLVPYMPISDAALGAAIQANVPIFASKAAAQSVTGGIASGVKSIDLQFYNPLYAQLPTLVGGGRWSRMSKATIDAAAYPSQAQFRSLDRFMPDGTTDSTNGGYWVLNDPEPQPQQMGLVGETTPPTTDQTTILQAWFTLCGILSVPAKVNRAATVKLTDTVTITPSVDVDISLLRIYYDGPRDRTALSVTGTTNRTLRFGWVQGTLQAGIPDWSNPAFIGITFNAVVNCFIWMQMTRYFNTGYALVADAGEGCAYNNIWPGRLNDNQTHELLLVTGASGFVNENRFHGGNYEMSSISNGLGASVGSKSAKSASMTGIATSVNNNRWLEPCFELGGTVGPENRTPFFFDETGAYCVVMNARAESCRGPLAICNGEDVRINEFGFEFIATGAQQTNLVQEINGAYNNTLRGRGAREVHRTFDNMQTLLSSGGGANTPYLRGDLFLIEAATGAPVRSSVAAAQLRSNALALDLAGSTGVMAAIDTTKIKQLFIDTTYAPGAASGTMIALAFDASGNRLTGNGPGTAWVGSTAYAVGDIRTNDTNKIYRCKVGGTSASSGGPTGTTTTIADGTCTWAYVGVDKYIRTGSNVATASFGGGYTHGSLTGTSISVRPEVAEIWVGVYASAPRSMEFTGYTSTGVDAAIGGGRCSLATRVPLNDSGASLKASANPGTAGTHGYYNVGDIIENTGAGAGQPIGWQCTTAGWLAAAWVLSTAYSVLGLVVTNDSGKMYQLVTAGTSASSGGPTGTGSAITDGTCVWNYVGVKAVFQAISAGSGDLLSTNNLSDLASAATARTNLGMSANGASLVTAANYAAMRALLDLEAGTDFYSISAANAAFQAIDAQLSSLIRQNNQSAAYTLVLTDGGKMISHPAADTTARIWTIPANGSVAFPIGTVVTFENEYGAGAITIAITTDTMELVGSAGSTGSRTLATGGRATAIKVGTTKWRISGQELT